MVRWSSHVLFGPLQGPPRLQAGKTSTEGVRETKHCPRSSRHSGVPFAARGLVVAVALMLATEFWTCRRALG